MSDKIVQHPRRDMKLERDIAWSPEARALQEAITKAVSAYADYLERTGLVFNDEADDAIGWRDDRPKSLVVRWEFNQGMVITLDGGPNHPEPSHPDEFFRYR
jgi:hypothetical protein